MIVQIGDLTFPTKGTATEHFRRMLNRYAVGDRVADGDAVQLASLLRKHPDAEQKIGTGVDYFSVRNAEFGTRCFEVVRSDGSAIDFSFRWCVGNSGRDEAENAVRASGDVWRDEMAAIGQGTPVFKRRLGQ
jgi:hypothetical protein